MDQRTNAQVIEAVYQAFSTGDLAAFDAYSDDSIWDEAGRTSPMSPEESGDPRACHSAAVLTWTTRPR